ncbi:MAG TPA: flagellar hook protein FlgE [Myxococcota bacterium]|nr:flagellar hook protein FlgE [Myxococcota bacterium]
MSLFGTLNTGASGLGVSSTSMSVIGDNIANINTTGFKGTRASFADLIPNGIGGLNGQNQLGGGAGLASTMTLFGQGSVSSSDSALDMAISGKGFFQVNDGDNSYYTRDGAFYMDADGFLTTSSGLRLQGYNAYDGDLTSRISDLRIDTAPTDPEATENITLDLNLPIHDADEDGNYGSTLSSATLDGASETWDDLEGDFVHSTSTTIYDDYGVAHDVVIYFEQTGADSWDYKVVTAATELDPTADPDGEGYVTELMDGTLTFDGTDLESIEQTMTSTDPWATGSTMDFEVEFGVDSSGDDDDGSISMSGESFAAYNISQDGYASGEVSSVQIDDDGQIIASYSNGKDEILGQIALATFAADSFLSRAGGNLFRATPDSGEGVLGAAGVGGRGSVNGYALEGSNVELEDQFVAMIQSQRSYQANARVVSTANDTLQELVNLV